MRKFFFITALALLLGVSKTAYSEVSPHLTTIAAAAVIPHNDSHYVELISTNGSLKYVLQSNQYIFNTDDNNDLFGLTNDLINGVGDVSFKFDGTYCCSIAANQIYYSQVTQNQNTGYVVITSNYGLSNNNFDIDQYQLYVDFVSASQLLGYDDVYIGAAIIGSVVPEPESLILFGFATTLLYAGCIIRKR